MSSSQVTQERHSPYFASESDKAKPLSKAYDKYLTFVQSANKRENNLKSVTDLRCYHLRPGQTRMGWINENFGNEERTLLKIRAH